MNISRRLPSGRARKPIVWARVSIGLGCAFLCLIAVPPAHAQLPGIDSPQPINAFLNGNLPANIPGVGSGNWEVVDAFPNLTFTDPVLLLPKPNSTNLFVVGKPGLIWEIPNNPAATPGDISTVLDISPLVRLGGDTGLLSMAFHPEFGQPGSPNRGYFYIWYRYTAPPADQDSF
jgi:hypothetical protein